MPNSENENLKGEDDSPSAAPGSARELICEVCLKPYEGEDDVSYVCGVCDREGFCRDCSDPQHHDCE